MRTCSNFSIQIGLSIFTTILALSKDFNSLGFFTVTLPPVLLSIKVFSKIWAISPSSTNEWVCSANSKPLDNKISFGSSNKLILATNSWHSIAQY